MPIDYSRYPQNVKIPMMPKGVEHGRCGLAILRSVMPNSHTTQEAREKRVLELLALPYSYCFVLEEDGRFSAYVGEFPGCYSQGDTIEEAYSCLREAAHNWLEASLRLGHEILPPLECWHGAPRERIALSALMKWSELGRACDLAESAYNKAAYDGGTSEEVEAAHKELLRLNSEWCKVDKSLQMAAAALHPDKSEDER